MLNPTEVETIREALGIWGSRKTPRRNFCLSNDRGASRPVLLGLAVRGLVVEGERIGKACRAFRVTTAGAKAIGKRLKPELQPAAPEAANDQHEERLAA